jgi:hypothetical protein
MMANSEQEKKPFTRMRTAITASSSKIVSKYPSIGDNIPHFPCKSRFCQPLDEPLDEPRKMRGKIGENFAG